MTPTDAATLLVELYGRYRHANGADQNYERAIALACAALQRGAPEAHMHVCPLGMQYTPGGVKK